MRSIIGISVACGALVMTAMAPASAANLSSQDVATGYEITMTKSDARQMGVAGKLFGTYAIAQSDKGTPDAPWLCDLSGEESVQGKGASDIISREYISLEGRSVSSANQELHVYGTPNQAKRAYDGIVAKIKQCEGAQQPAADPDQGELGGMTTQLTNGTKKASDGDSFLWVRSETTISGVDGFASHEYSTVRYFGRYLQIIQLESQGTGAPKLTAKQIRTTDTMTDVLGDRWRASFG